MNDQNSDSAGAPIQILLAGSDTMTAPMRKILLRAGYSVEVGSVKALGAGDHDLALVEATPPQTTNYEHLATYLQSPHPPLIVFNGSENLSGAIALFEAGADELLIAGFGAEELLARVRRGLQRTVRQPSSVTLTGGPITVDVLHRRVRVQGRSIVLTKLEFDLLSFFLMHPDEPLTRERLLREVWGFSTGTTTTVTVHVRRLRERIEDNPAQPMLLRTVWRVGYRFSPTP